jgi:hypothetical protein
MAIVAETSATNSLSGSGTTITIDKPTGTVAGDVLVALIRSDSTPGITGPTDWVLVEQNAVNNRNLAMLYKVAGGSEPANYEFTYAFSCGTRGGGITRFSGVDNTTPSDATASERSGTSTTHTYSSITTATNGAMLVGAATSNSSSFSPTPPSPLVEQWETQRSALSCGIQATAGATGDLTGTHESLSLNYNCILWALKPASGGGGAEGTLSATLGTLIASATGAIALDGDLTAALGTLVLSAAAALDITGDLTATLGAVTLSAAGEVAITADLSATLDALTTTAAGTLALEGTLSATLGSLTLSATGELVEGASGSLSATLGALTANATGELALRAALSQALEALTATATGALDIAGDVDATLGALALSAEGTLTAGPSGQLAATLGILTAQATGTIALTAQATVALGALTLNANGEIVLTGQAVIALAALTLSAQGVETVAAVTYVYGTITGPGASGTVQGPAATGTIGG